MYNRAAHVHKLVYEGLHRFILNKMEDKNADSFELSSTLSDMQEKVKTYLKILLKFLMMILLRVNFLNNSITLSLITSYT